MRISLKILFLVLGAVMLASTAVNAQNRIVDSLKALVRMHPSDTLGVDAATELCYELRFINQDSALFFGELAVTRSKKIDYSKGLSQAYSDIGTVYYDKGDLEKAEERWLKSLALREKRKDISKMASVHVSLGALNFKLGKFEKSLEHQLKALELYQSKGQDAGVSRAFNNVAAVYEQQNQLDKALDYYRQSYAMKLKLKDYSQMAQTQVNIGNIYYRRKEYKLAKRELLSANQSLQNDRRNADILGITYNNLSELYRATGDYDSALLMTNRALEIRESIGDYSGLVSSLNSKGTILGKLKRYEDARRFLQQALDSATLRKLEPERAKIFQNFYELFQASGNTAEALRYFQLYTAIKDSIFDEKSRMNINELQVKYDTEQKEKQFLEQKALAAANETRIVFLGALLLLMVVSGFFIYKALQSRRIKSEQESTYKLQLSEARLETELREDRLRISRELHDNIGSRLLFLSTVSESLGGGEKAEQLSTFTRNTLHELRRTVWLINHDEVTLEELELKFTEYFGFLKQSSALDIRIAVVADPAIMIRSPKAAALFRVTQEAVSNAIKHARATAVVITISTPEPKRIMLVLEDNGAGFDAAQPSTGNGLKNMEVHAEQVKGSVSLTSSPAGTKITMTIPL